MATIDEERLPDSVLAEVPRQAEERNGGDHRTRDENLELEGLDLELLAGGASGELDLGERKSEGEQEEGEPGEGGAEESVVAEAEEAEEFFECAKSIKNVETHLTCRSQSVGAPPRAAVHQKRRIVQKQSRDHRSAFHKLFKKITAYAARDSRTALLYGDHEISFQRTPVVHVRMPAALRLKLPHIPCVTPQVDHD
ncbi:hypothetical protein SASPL_154853 [Salvia splendens]|uniref:Uncharacterized protein n=1 Tax=Salvia splendens TaxID=180675 RepID=A0A8X8W0U0_SALSN|nr:hypothetical protein SASPL_154853 [Salvia splendens]